MPLMLSITINGTATAVSGFNLLIYNAPAETVSVIFRQFRVIAY